MAKKHDYEALVAKAIGVREIATDDLLPNPHNPRHLFDEEPMSVLRESIRKVGILVPLTVYWDKHKDHYVILDGQRRWMCAQKVGLAKVPVQEVERPSDIQNIVTMFQIHKLRQDWELMPTALKLRVIMTALRETNEGKLAELTGLNVAVVVRCKKLLTYPAKYQNMMLDPIPETRLKADFFIEMYAVRNDRFVNKMPWYRKQRFTEAMLGRLKDKKFRSVTDFRIIKEHITNARKAGKKKTISQRLQEFTENPDLPIDHLAFASARSSAAARALEKQVRDIHNQVARLDVEQCIGEENMWSALEALVTLIQKRLVEAGRRPSK